METLEGGDAMESSILKSVRKTIGLDPDDSSFDIDLVMNINTTISFLTQLGVSPIEEPFFVEDDKQYWTDYLDEEDTSLSLVKSYICYKVRMMFDPPTTSIVMESLKNTISELEFRINHIAESRENEVDQNG